MWNQNIAPAVREAVKRGTGSSTGSGSDGQQKVANTALYVLMQRSVILSCPLNGQGLWLLISVIPKILLSLLLLSNCGNGVFLES